MKIKEMRALSLVQPRAAIMMEEGGSVEERSWSTNTRGYIAIHASSTFKRANFEESAFNPDEVDYGAIVGFARLEHVEGEKGNFELSFCDVIKLKEPVEIKGMMNLWKLHGKELNKCLNQLSQTHMRRIEASLQS